MNNFNLTFQGTLGETLLPTELGAPKSAFVKACQNFWRELETAGVKTITSAVIDVAGRKTTIPIETHAGVT